MTQVEEQTAAEAEREYPPDFPYTLTKMAEVLSSNGVEVRRYSAKEDGRKFLLFIGDDDEGMRAARVILDNTPLGFHLTSSRCFIPEYKGYELNIVWEIVFPKLMPLGGQPLE